MRKISVFAALMLALVTLTALTPAIKAVTPTFTWDENIQFVTDPERIDVYYAHPDRYYHGISPLEMWSEIGYKLHHNQLDLVTVNLIKGSAVLVGAAIGTAIGSLIAFPYGSVVGCIVGGILGLAITWLADEYFLDEVGCVWWWTSINFVQKLIENALTIWLYSFTNPIQAEYLVLSLFFEYGYLRVGKLTFYDAINPKWDYSDLSNDGVVDIDDVMVVTTAFGSKPGDPNWNPVADITEDGLVDIDDVIIVAGDFGEFSYVWPLPDGL